MLAIPRCSLMQQRQYVEKKQLSCDTKSEKYADRSQPKWWTLTGNVILQADTAHASGMAPRSGSLNKKDALSCQEVQQEIARDFEQRWKIKQNNDSLQCFMSKAYTK